MIVNIVWNDAPISGGGLTGGFNTSGGYVQLFFAGSGWSSSGGPLGVQLILDGNPVTTARGFSNEPSSHKTLVPSVAVLKPTPGPHTVKIAPLPGTNVDGNDFFTLTATEYL